MPTILLAVDNSEFSRAAVDEIVDHMRPDAMTVHVLHVLELDHMVTPATDFARGANYGSDVVAHVRKDRADAERLVQGVGEKLRSAGFRATTALREGEPRHAILDYAAEIDADAIVLGSHGRRGVSRFFMGSVSDAVSRHAHCSVHVVRLHRGA